MARLNIFYNPNKSSSKLKKCLNARLDTTFSICVFFSGSRALFTRSTNTLFSNKNFKIGSNDTIHIFKNYFAIIFLVFSNKQYSNGPLINFLVLFSLFISIIN